MTADVLDVFAVRADPRARRERPALFAARLAWAERRVATERGQSPPPPLGIVGGIGVGDRVHVELAPGLFWRGQVIEWVNDPLPLAKHPSSVARVMLDTYPPGVIPPAGFAGGKVVTRPRAKLSLILEFA